MYESQIVSLEQSVKQAEAALFERQAELAELRATLAAFEREYEALIGAKLADLERIELQVEDCQQRLEAHRLWGRLGAAGAFGDRAAREGAPARSFSFAEFAQELVSELGVQPSSPEQAEQIKKLYRQLCRRFHPDLASDEADLVCRTDMMLQINAAYEALDLDGLVLLAGRPDCDEVSAEDVARQRLGSLRVRLQDLGQQLDRVEYEIGELMRGDLMDLSLQAKLLRREGRDLLAEMAADVDAELAAKRGELDALKAQMQERGIEWEV